MKRVVLYYLVIAAMLVITAATVASCDREDTKEREQCEKLEQNGYSVTVCSDKNGTVSITSEPGEYLDRLYEIITISATANSGYRFLEWQTIDGIIVSGSTDNPTTFGMSHDADAVVMKAIFVPSVGLPKTIDIWQDNQGPTIVRYKYDILNRFTEKRLILNNSGYILTSDIYLIYDDNRDLVRYRDIRSPQSRSMGATFSQDGNKITFTLNDHYCVSCDRTVEGEFELNAQGLPVQLTYKEEYSQGIDLTVKRRTYADVSLAWQNGNITKTDRKSESEREEKYWYEEESKIEKSPSVTNTVIYTHDDKKTPFSQCNTPKWFFWWIDFFEHESVFYGNNKNYNKNNIKTETRENGSTITYEYTYNADGFPMTRSWEQEKEWEAGTTSYTETYTYH